MVINSIANWLGPVLNSITPSCLGATELNTATAAPEMKLNSRVDAERPRETTDRLIAIRASPVELPTLISVGP